MAASAAEVHWPARWQQEAIEALLPYVGGDERVSALLGDPGESVSGTAMEGHVYVEDGELMIIWDRSGRADVYPWKMLSGPVLRIELLVPKRRRQLLFAVPGWEKRG
jgi:hypothetical protein